MTKAIVYTRFSPRPNASECESCQNQAERCIRYCDKKGYNIGAVFNDESSTGGIYDRPILHQAIEKLSSGAVLVVDAPDRLARDMLVALTIEHEVKKAGASIEYANGTASGVTPEGELLRNILAAFAQYERSRIRKRTSDGMAKRQAAGEWFGKPPIGWKLDENNKKRLVPAGNERLGWNFVVARAKSYEAYAVRLSADNVIAHLRTAVTRAHGLFRGRPWSKRTIRRILKSGKTWEEYDEDRAARRTDQS